MRPSITIGPAMWFVSILLIAGFIVGCCHDAPSAPASASRPAVRVVTVTTRPTIEVGDWVRIEVPAGDALQPRALIYGRVSRGGTVRFPGLGRVQIAGKTPAAVERHLTADYANAPDTHGNVTVTVTVVAYQQPGDPLPRNIQPFDLVRVDVDQLQGGGRYQCAALDRVAGDGTIRLPLLGPVKIAGLDEEESEKTIAGNYGDSAGLIRNISVNVTVVEQAPPDAERLDFPDGPVYPVPTMLKPLFDPHKPLPEPGIAESAMRSATATVQEDRSGPSLLTRFSAHPGLIRPGDWLEISTDSLTASLDPAVSYARVTADGFAVVPFLSRIRVAGQTKSEVEKAMQKANADAQVLRNAVIKVRSIYLQQPDAPGPRAIEAFDLVRVEFFDSAAAAPTTVIRRVGADGTMTLPMAGSVRLSGLTDAAATAAVVTKLPPGGAASVSAMVTTLEPAPADAAGRALPDGPVNPVPEPLLPVFSW